MNDELASRINEILFTQWDPIGVNDTPEHTQNEYYRYTPQIIDALNSGASKDDIAQLLDKIVTEYMELEPDPVKNREVAQAIIDLK